MNAALNDSPAVLLRAAEFLDHADISALMAPGFVDNTGVERHAGEPWPLLASLLVADSIRPNESLGEGLSRFFQAIAAIVEPLVRSEVREKGTCRNHVAAERRGLVCLRQIAQIDLAESIAPAYV